MRARGRSINQSNSQRTSTEPKPGAERLSGGGASPRSVPECGRAPESIKENLTFDTRSPTGENSLRRAFGGVSSTWDGLEGALAFQPRTSQRARFRALRGLPSLDAEGCAVSRRAA